MTAHGLSAHTHRPRAPKFGAEMRTFQERQGGASSSL